MPHAKLAASVFARIHGFCAETLAYPAGYPALQLTPNEVTPTWVNFPFITAVRGPESIDFSNFVNTIQL